MGKEMRKLIIPKEAILPIWRMGIDAAREAIRPKAFSRPESRLSLAQEGRSVAVCCMRYPSQYLSASWFFARAII